MQGIGGIQVKDKQLSLAQIREMAVKALKLHNTSEENATRVARALVN